MLTHARAQVLGRCVQRLVSGPSAATLWGLAGSVLSTFQNLALLEGVHSMLGMVSSPLATTGVTVTPPPPPISDPLPTPTTIRTCFFVVATDCGLVGGGGRPQLVGGPPNGDDEAVPNVSTYSRLLWGLK